MYEDLQIVIPSRSRPRIQKTLKNLSQNFWKLVTIVVPSHQYVEYREFIPKRVAVVPLEYDKIGEKRNFILKMRPNGKLIMFDDDLTFYRRSVEDDSKFIRMNQTDSEEMVYDIWEFLDRYVMVGMTDKFMSHTRPRGFVECSRCNKVLAFNRNTLPVPWPEFRLPHDEEHDVHLQLLTRGYKTAVITEYSKSDGVETPGGCTDWRSPEVFSETYRLLTEYWPTIVTVAGDKKVRYNWREAKRIGGIL